MAETCENPWLGLNTYKENNRLYGRDHESEEVSDIITNNVLTIIYGRSGIGKSSLLQAGVFPRLRYNDFMPVYIRLEHNSDTNYTAQVLAKLGDEAKRSNSILELEGINDITDTHLSDLFNKISVQDNSTGLPQFITLVFDQFEEIFTLPNSDHKPQVETFFSQIAEVLNATQTDGCFRIVICLREDYLYYLEKVSVTIPSLKRNRYSLQPLNRQQGHDVICLPRKGLVPEEQAEDILNKIDPDHTDVIAPSILSLFMHELYEKGNGIITSENISTFGDHIISDFYEEGMKNISASTTAFLEDRLVTCDGYRHAISYNDAIVHGANREELEWLKNRRIITITKGERNQRMIEFAHDMLCPIVINNRQERQQKKEAEKLRIKAKAIKHKQRIVIMLFLIIFFVIGVIAALFFKLEYMDKEADQTKKRYDYVLRFKTDSLTTIENELKAKREKLDSALTSLATKQEELDTAGAKLDRERDRVLAHQSRLVSKIAMDLAEKGHFIKAMALVAEVFPHDVAHPTRPFVREAYDALMSLDNRSEGLEMVFKHISHTNAVLSPNGRYLAMAYFDNTIRVWNINNNQCISTLKGHTRTITALDFAPDDQHLVSASDDGTVRIWNVNGRCLHSFHGHESYINSVTFSPEGNRIVTSSGDSTARVWDAKTGLCIRVFSGHSDDVKYAAFSPDGNNIVTASKDTARIWNIMSGQCTRIFEGHDGRLISANYSPNGKYIVTASVDKTARIWDIETGRCLHTLKGHSASVSFASYSSDGKRIVTASEDTTVRIWNPTNAECVNTFVGASFGLRFAEFSSDGNRIAVSSYGGNTYIYNVQKSRKSILDGHSNRVTFADYSPDGKLIATSSIDGTACVWNMETGLCVRTLSLDSCEISSVRFCPDNKHVVVFTQPGYIRVWNTENGQCSLGQAYSIRIKFPSLSPNGKLIATSTSWQTVNVWNIETGQCERTMLGHTSIINSASFSPDGKQIVTSSSDKTARIWDVESGRCLRTLRGHHGVVYSASYSPDGKYIVTASQDYTAVIWNAANGQAERKLLGHTEDVNSASFSSDGKYIITGSNDKTARLWDTESGKCVGILQGHSDVMTSASFSPDNIHVVTSSKDKTARIWDIDPQQLINRTLKISKNYQLSEEDRKEYHLE